MKKHSSTFTYIGIMTALYGLLIMGAVYAAASISTTSQVSPLNLAYASLSQSLSGISTLFVLLGVLVLAIGLLSWNGDK